MGVTRRDSQTGIARRKQNQTATGCPAFSRSVPACTSTAPLLLLKATAVLLT